MKLCSVSLHEQFCMCCRKYCHWWPTLRIPSLMSFCREFSRRLSWRMIRGESSVFSRQPCMLPLWHTVTCCICHRVADTVYIRLLVDLPPCCQSEVSALKHSRSLVNFPALSDVKSSVGFYRTKLHRALLQVRALSSVMLRYRDHIGWKSSKLISWLK